jgi:two-component system, OmpR family, response regulator
MPQGAAIPKLPGPILLVDDDSFVREVVVAALAPAGVRVHACASGEEALAVISGLTPALVVLDSLLPGGNGLSVWTAMRAALTKSGQPMPYAIFLTARPTPALADAPGALGVIAKPFNPATLFEDMCRLLAVDVAAPYNGRPERLAAVATAFYRSLPLMALEVEELGRVLRGHWSQETAEALRAKAHGLAGRAGLFGRDTLGKSAEDVERALLNGLKRGVDPLEDARTLANLVNALVVGCRAG